MDLNNIKGFNKLTEQAKAVFIRVYANHRSAVGNEYKDGWTAIAVKERRKGVEVIFKNGEWLHYTPNGTWY